MLERFEKKIAATIHSFFFFGLVSVGLGFLALSNEVFTRLFVAVGFFLTGLLFLHIAYHIQDLRNHLAELISTVKKPIVESALHIAANVARQKRKKKPARRKVTVKI